MLSEVHSADGKTDIVQVVEKAPNSQASGFSNLMVNDQIIRVGQTNVMGMDFEHVMDTIKKQKTTETNSPLKLVFISAPQKSHQTIASASLPQGQKATPQKAAGKPEEKTFNFDKGRSLGLVLSEVHSADGKTDIVQVVEKAPNSQASGFSNLMVNDQIIRVGQTNVMGMDFEHVMDTIKKQKTTETNSPLKLVFISAQQSSPKKSASRALATPATGDSKSKPSPSTTSASSSKAKARGAKKSTSPGRKSSTAGSKANRVRSAGVKTPTSAGRKSSVSAGRKSSVSAGRKSSASAGKKTPTSAGRKSSASAGRKKSVGQKKSSSGGKKKS